MTSLKVRELTSFVAPHFNLRDQRLKMPGPVRRFAFVMIVLGCVAPRSGNVGLPNGLTPRGSLRCAGAVDPLGGMSI
jgi:hypothetical protein